MRIVTQQCNPQDRTGPANVEVRTAEFGDVKVLSRSKSHHVTTGGMPRDPLVLFLDGLEPGATLQLLKTNDPQVDWKDEAQIKEWPIPLVPMQTAGLALTNTTAASLGIEPGDIFELRQKDCEGHVSPVPTEVVLRNDGSSEGNFHPPEATHIGELAIAEPDDTNFEFRWLSLARYQDRSAPIVHEDRMSLVAQECGAEFSGDKAIERHGTAEIVNLRTREIWTSEPTANGSFCVTQTDLMPGDPYQVRVYDHSGNRADLPPGRFLDTCSEG